MWDLAPLRKLTHLYATDNQLQDIKVNIYFFFIKNVLIKNVVLLRHDKVVRSYEV